MGFPGLLPKGGVRSSRTTIISVASLVIITLLVALTYHRSDAWADRIPSYSTDTDLPPDVDASYGNSEGAESPEASASAVPVPEVSVPEVSVPVVSAAPAVDPNEAARELFMKTIFKPSVNVDSKSYIPYGVFGHNLSSTPIWTKPLGKKLCIIDLDNRPLNDSGLIFGTPPMSWDAMNWDDASKVGGQSLGVLNHWLYAKIHGYSYYYVGTVEPEGRRSSWLKAPIIAKILKEHDTCVYLDADAVFTNLDLPLEWLMNYWNIDPKKDILALANDPGGKGNHDLQGKTNHNTGFIIAQNTPKTYAVMKDWWDCPDPKGKFPGCDFFNFRAAPGRPSDQGGWGSFVRYAYPGDIKTLSCKEANGFPESKSGCDGTFIGHFWTGKHTWIKMKIGSQLPGAALSLFHEKFLEEKDTFYMSQDELFDGRGPYFEPLEYQPPVQNTNMNATKTPVKAEANDEVKSEAKVETKTEHQS